jgi:hypothetical protein
MKETAATRRVTHSRYRAAQPVRIALEGPAALSVETPSVYSGRGSLEVEAQLKAEVADLMARAESAGQANIPDGMSACRPTEA